MLRPTNPQPHAKREETVINFKVPGEKSDAYEAAEKKRTLLVQQWEKI